MRLPIPLPSTFSSNSASLQDFPPQTLGSRTIATIHVSRYPCHELAGPILSYESTQSRQSSFSATMNPEWALIVIRAVSLNMGWRSSWRMRMGLDWVSMDGCLDLKGFTTAGFILYYRLTSDQKSSTSPSPPGWPSRRTSQTWCRLSTTLQTMQGHHSRGSPIVM